MALVYGYPHQWSLEVGLGRIQGPGRVNKPGLCLGIMLLTLVYIPKVYRTKNNPFPKPRPHALGLFGFYVKIPAQTIPSHLVPYKITLVPSTPDLY